MKWYAAHLVMYVKFKEARQDHYPIWENIILVRARTEKEAFRKAEQRGRLDEGDDDGSFRWGGKLATWIFAGIRKLTLCEDSTVRPGDGTEVTFLEMQTASKREIEQFVAGEPVSMKFVERFRDEEEDAGREVLTRSPALRRVLSAQQQSENGESIPRNEFWKQVGHAQTPKRKKGRGKKTPVS